MTADFEVRICIPRAKGDNYKTPNLGQEAVVNGLPGCPPMRVMCTDIEYSLERDATIVRLRYSGELVQPCKA